MARLVSALRACFWIWPLLFLAGCASLAPVTEPTVALTPAEQATWLYAAAQLAEAQGNLDQAGAYLQRALAYDPQSLTLRRRAAVTLLRQNRAADAVSVFRPVAESPTAGPKARYLMGQLDEAAGNTAGAMAIYRELLREPSPQPEVLSALGLLLLKQDATADGVAYLRQALQGNPDDREARDALVKHYLSTDHGGVAEILVKEALLRSPDDRGWLQAMATVQHQLGRDDEAAKVYQQVLEIDARAFEAHAFLAGYWLGRQDWTAAARELEWLVREEPDEAKWRRQLGLACYWAGRLDEARDQLRALVAAGESDPMTHFILGSIHRDKKYWRLAVQEFRLALDLNPSFQEASLELANALIEAGDRGEATTVAEEMQNRSTLTVSQQMQLGLLILRMDRPVRAAELFTKALTAEPGNARALFYLGRAYLALGQTPAAIAAWQKAIAADPKLAEAYNHLAYVHAERGENLDQALRWALKALALDPDNGNYHDTLGWVYFRLGRLVQAENELQLALKSLQRQGEPIDPVVYDHLAQVYAGQGRLGEAERSWQFAINLDPHNPDFISKLQKIRLRQQPEHHAAPDPKRPSQN